MATEASKGWRGCFKVVYQAYVDDDCIEAGDITVVNAAECEEHIDDVTTDIDGGLDAMYKLGKRTPKEILEGNISLRLHVKRQYIDRRFSHLAGIDSSYMLPGKVCIGVFPLGYTTDKPAIYMCGKFSNWKFNLPQPDVMTEEMDFIGQCISTGLVP